MRWNLIHGLGFSISVVLAGLSLASLASAQATPTMQTGHAELIKTLERAHHLLVHADHDYDGHRAKAAEEVHKALEELRHNHRKVQPATTTPATAAAVPAQTTPAAQATPAVHAGQAKMHEAQGSSDEQLREARRHLDRALPHLTSRHPRATANVQAAIAEIDTALKIK